MNTSTAFETTIKAYLDKRSEEDEFFRRKYENSQKNISECCKYIMSEIFQNAKRCNATVGYGATDEEVYSLAMHYYDEENIKIQSTNMMVVVNHQVELTREEKAAIEKQVKKEALLSYEKKVKAEIDRRNQKRVKRNENEQQLTLF